MATIRFTTKVSGVLTDVTSVSLCDPTGSYGIQRTDSLATVVAANVILTNIGTGTYSYDFSADEPGVEYRFYVKWVYNGEDNYVENIYTAAVEGAAVSITTMPSNIIWSYSVEEATLFSDPNDDDEWPLYIGHLPDGNEAPNECAAIYNTTGIFNGKDMWGNIDQHFGVEFHVRSLTEADGYDRTKDIEDDFKDVHNVDITVVSGEVWRLYNLHQTTPVVTLGVDEQRRFHHTINFACCMKML